MVKTWEAKKYDPEKPLSPLKAIRAKCLDCSAESHHEVSICVIPTCSLYPWRFGKRPQTIARQVARKKAIADSSAS